jgi:hypothetical protein
MYNVCQGVPSAFSLDVSTTTDGKIDTNCITDYIAIPGKVVQSD